MAQKLLILTDFSPNSLDASKYAASLALSKGYPMHLLHFYTVRSSNFQDEKNAPSPSSPLLKADITILNLLTDLEEQYEGVTITQQCERGLLDDKLPQIVKRHNYDFIVLGAKGHSAVRTFFWGTTTAKITDISPVPVLVVPSGYTEFKTTKVGLLTNFKAEELDTLKKFIAMSGGPIEHLTLVHAYSPSEDLREIQEKMEAWLVHLEGWEGLKKVDYVLDAIKDEDVERGALAEQINRKVQAEGIDILVITKTRRSFFRKLFQDSVSRKLAQTMVVPSFFDK